MRKVLSILFALLILISGLHLTVASHICGGELAAVKWSVTGAKATCGMEEGTAPSCPANGEMNTNCCKNIVTSCTADSNYFPVAQAAKVVPVVLTPLFTDLSFVPAPSPSIDKTYHSMVGPPVLENWNSVDQTIVCVFII